jgi:hypothetical protein
MTHAATVLGGFAESMEKMLQDGVFFRMGRKMAEQREEAFWRAFMAETADEPILTPPPSPGASAPQER